MIKTFVKSVLEELQSSIRFMRGQYKKAPLLQKIFVWYSWIICNFLILVAIAAAVYDSIVEGDSTEDSSTANDPGVNLSRNILFGLAFGVFGLTSILGENVFEFISWGAMTIGFTLGAIYSVFSNMTSSEFDPFDITVLTVAGVIFTANVIFFAMIYRSLGKHSSITFYAAGSNVSHRRAFQQYLRFAAVLKMDFFFLLNLYVNITVYLYGFGASVPRGNCPEPFDNQNCASRSSFRIPGTLLLTLGLILAFGWDFFCYKGLRQENRFGSILAVVGTWAIPIAGIIAGVYRKSNCCDTPFIISLAVFILARAAMSLFMSICIINFGNGLSKVLDRRTMFGRSIETETKLEDVKTTTDKTDDQFTEIEIESPKSKNNADKGVVLEAVAVVDDDNMSVSTTSSKIKKGFKRTQVASDTKCSGCARVIPSGSHAFWKRGAGLFHEECVQEE